MGYTHRGGNFEFGDEPKDKYGYAEAYDKEIKKYREEMLKQYRKDLDFYKKETIRINKTNEQISDEHKLKVEELKKKYQSNLQEWKNKSFFYKLFNYSQRPKYEEPELQLLEKPKKPVMETD